MKHITLPAHIPEEARGAYMQFIAAQAVLEDFTKREMGVTDALNVLGFLSARIIEQVQEPEAAEALIKGYMLSFTSLAQNHLARLNTDPAVAVRQSIPNKAARSSAIHACLTQVVQQNLDDREFMKPEDQPKEIIQ